MQLVAQATKRPPGFYSKWLFTKRDYYRDPNGLPDLAALQQNIDYQKKLGFIRQSLDVKKYADLSLVKAAARRLSKKAAK